jgi:hypothetical protein
MQDFLLKNPWLILGLILLSLIWKGIALWKAARNNHKKWFVALMFLNTLCILEILYIFVFSKRKEEKVKN